MTARRIAILALAAGVGWAGAARAGDLAVTVRDARGAPVADAVVTLDMPGREPPARYAQPLRLSQRNQQFAPTMLVVPVGAEVRVVNEDKVRHHVYSFSPAKRFELKLFGRDETHVVKFDKPGAVALGCNIHDNMVAYVKVVDAAFASVTDTSGTVVFRGLPAGPAQVRVWKPNLRAPGNELSAHVSIPATGVAAREFTAMIAASPH